MQRHKRLRFHLWVRKMPWRKVWQPTPVFLPRESSWTKDPGRLQYIVMQRVGHDWINLACTHAMLHDGPFSNRHVKILFTLFNGLEIVIVKI